MELEELESVRDSMEMDLDEVYAQLEELYEIKYGGYREKRIEENKQKE